MKASPKTSGITKGAATATGAAARAVYTSPFPAVLAIRRAALLSSSRIASAVTDVAIAPAISQIDSTDCIAMEYTPTPAAPL